MTAGRADATNPRPRPRPQPSPAEQIEPSAETPADAPSRGSRRRSGRGLARPDASTNAQLAAAAGGAVVTAARVGRLLGRSGWRIAKQLPGVTVVEQQAQRLRQAAAAEVFRVLDLPQQLFGPASPEEQRVMMLVHDGETDPAPLRTAMSELLHRSSEASGRKSRDYLFGTIVSQLVPDEARILARLADGRSFATIDVVAKAGARSAPRIVLANVSTVGAAAGVGVPRSTATYLTRLKGFGLIDFDTPADDLADQFATLNTDEAVLEARASIARAKLGTMKFVRKSVSLSPLGREFWAACAPDRTALAKPTD